MVRSAIVFALSGSFDSASTCAARSRPLGFLALLYPVHLWAASRAARAGLDFDTVSRFQNLYRVLYGGIGLAMILSLVLR